MVDLIIIFPFSLEKVSDLNTVNSYTSAQAYNIYKYLKDIKSLNIEFYGPEVLLPDTGIFYDHKNRPIRTDKKIDLSIFKNRSIKHVLITGVNRAKFYSSQNLSDISKLINGNIFQIDDSNYRDHPIVWTIGHFYRENKSSRQSICLDLVVDTDLFLPNQKYDRDFKVHVDHRFVETERLECFELIKEKLRKINSIVSKSSKWDKLTVYYHTDIINFEDINKIGKYDASPCSISELAAIYGSCHLSMVSHEETLGQYPLEMLSSGVTVLSQTKFIPKQLRKKYPWYLYDDFDFENFIETVNKQTHINNRNSILNYSWKNWIGLLIKHLEKIGDKERK